MSGAGFIHCPDCSRLMLGRSGVPQPHECAPTHPADADVAETAADERKSDG